MEEDNKPLENQVVLEEVDLLTPKKPDDLLTDYTNLAKDTSSVLEEIEAFKEKYIEIFEKYNELLNKVADNEAKQLELKENLVTSMESANIASIGNDMFKVAFIAATTRNTFDTTKFKKEHQDLYQDYVKVSNVKAYVKITEVNKSE